MAGRSEIFCQSVAVDSSWFPCLFLYLAAPENGLISSAILSTSSLMYIPCFLLGGVTFRIFPVSTSRLNVLVDAFSFSLASLDDMSSICFPFKMSSPYRLSDMVSPYRLYDIIDILKRSLANLECPE